ncbi:hypothetical protein KKA47_02560, partial [bacterium]|nr:hypothetical protein [bacterium]
YVSQPQQFDQQSYIVHTGARVVSKLPPALLENVPHARIGDFEIDIAVYMDGVALHDGYIPLDLRETLAEDTFRYNLSFHDDLSGAESNESSNNIDPSNLKIADIPRYLSITAQINEQHYTKGWISAYEDVYPLDNSNGVEIGANFKPEIEIKPVRNLSEENFSIRDKILRKFKKFNPFAGSSSTLCKDCLYEWEVTVMARNIGNKPVYPVLEASVYGAEASSEHLNEYANLILGQSSEFDLNPWISRVASWKFASAVFSEAESLGECIPASPHIVLPGAAFCVKRVKLVAKPDSVFTLVLDENNLIPELNEGDNILYFTLNDNPDIQPARFTLPNPLWTYGRPVEYMDIPTKTPENFHMGVGVPIGPIDPSPIIRESLPMNIDHSPVIKESLPMNNPR